MPVTGQIKKTDDGAVVMARVARGSNVQDYLGSEMGFSDRAIVRVYRPETEVFSSDAIKSYARKPITIDHPKDGVNSGSWKDLAVGEIDPVGILRDGEFVTVALIFRDAAAITLIESADGPKELSMGYSADIEMVDGVSSKGEAYDAIMTNFRMNHVAVVREARGGTQLRIGDAQTWGASPCPPTQMKDNVMLLLTVVLGDRAVQVAPADAPILNSFKDSVTKAAADALATSVAALATKDEEIGTLKAENKKLSDAAMTPEKQTKLVADRVALETLAKGIAPAVVCTNVSDADLRKAAVAIVHGDDMVADASEAEISGMFKALAKDAGKTKDTFADTVKNGITVVTNDAWGAFLPKGK
jgi:hypothetical protein